MHRFADFVNETCARWGNRPCLRDGARVLSFADVAGLTDRLARDLAQGGAAPVAVVASGTADLYLLFLASVKAGRAFLPMSPALSARNIRGILDLFGLPHRVLAGPGVNIVAVDCAPLVDVIAQAQAGRQDQPMPMPVRDRDPVTYQTTSGSTGTPKVIPVSGENLLFQNGLTLEYCPVAPTAVAGICGDWVPRQFLAVFSQGACNSFCHVPSASRQEIVDWMCRTPIRHVSLYSNTLRVFGQIAEVFTDLDWVLCGGEPLTRAHVAAFERFAPAKARLINLYATQETGTMASHVHRHGDPVPDGAPAVGKSAVPGRLDVVDAKGQPVARGTEGEIVLRFGGNMVLECGYVGGARPLRLLADGAYCTGDRGYCDADGVFHVTGRVDDMVKINGFAIPMTEIERAMRAVPGVGDAAVKAIELNQTTRVLAAYYEGPAPRAHVRRALGGEMPGFMRPHYVIKVPELPRGATGKVAKGKLQFHPGQDRVPADGVVMSGLAREIGDIWAGLLGHRAFDANSAFFEVGGESLSAIQLALEIERRYGHRIGIADFLEVGASIAGLVGLLTRSGVSSTGGEPPRDPPGPRGDVSAAKVLQANAAILERWRRPGSDPRPGTRTGTGTAAPQFVCDAPERAGTALFWVVQAQGEYHALTRALGGMAVYGGRSFANLARQFDPSGGMQDRDLYESPILGDVAARMASELCHLSRGRRRIVLGANCQAVHILEAMIGQCPALLERAAGLVLLNPIRPFAVAAAPVTLLFGGEEAAEFQRVHGDPGAAFGARDVDILDGAHGTYFAGKSLDRIGAAVLALAR